MNKIHGRPATGNSIYYHPDNTSTIHIPYRMHFMIFTTQNRVRRLLFNLNTNIKWIEITTVCTPTLTDCESERWRCIQRKKASNNFVNEQREKESEKWQKRWFVDGTRRELSGLSITGLCISVSNADENNNNNLTNVLKRTFQTYNLMLPKLQSDIFLVIFPLAFFLSQWPSIIETNFIS